MGCWAPSIPHRISKGKVNVRRFFNYKIAFTGYFTLILLSGKPFHTSVLDFCKNIATYSGADLRLRRCQKLAFVSSFVASVTLCV